VFCRFLDDNDPRLILLVTFDESSCTTYMKVMKLEKIKGIAKANLVEVENDGVERFRQ
jgi:hypothetical protein